MNKKRKIIVTTLLLSVGSIHSTEMRNDKLSDRELKKLAKDFSLSLDPYSEKTKFKSLCDRDGYPLVGNVGNKGNEPKVEKQVYLKVEKFCKKTK